MLTKNLTSEIVFLKYHTVLLLQSRIVFGESFWLIDSLDFCVVCVSRLYGSFQCLGSGAILITTGKCDFNSLLNAEWGETSGKTVCGRLAKDNIIRVIEAPLFLLPAAGGTFLGECVRYYVIVPS